MGWWVAVSGDEVVEDSGFGSEVWWSREWGRGDSRMSGSELEGEGFESRDKASGSGVQIW